MGSTTKNPTDMASALLQGGVGEGGLTNGGVSGVNVVDDAPFSYNENTLAKAAGDAPGAAFRDGNLKDGGEEVRTC